MNKEVYIKFQENAWIDNTLFCYWLNNIWLSLNKFRNITNTLLILDRANAISINKLIEKYYSKFVLIYPGCTCYSNQ